MSDVLYHVRTVYETDTSKASLGMGTLKNEASKLGGVLSSLGGFARSVLTGAFVGGSIAAAVGLAALAHGVNTVNGEVDSLSVGIAGMVSAAGVEGTSGLTGWANSMSFAEGAMAQIRRDAAALPGEAGDFIEVFRAGLPGALETGMRAADVAQFTNRFAAVGIAFRVDSEQIGRDLNLMLGGRAGAHVMMWNRLKSTIGMSAEAFNALGASARRAKIDDALGRYAPMINAYSNTWEAISSTTTSYGENLLRLSTNPFFNVAKKELRSINDWWGAHEEAVNEVANGVGIGLVNAYKRARGAAAGLFDRMDAFVRSGTADRIYDLGSSVVSGVSGLASRAAGAIIDHPAAAAGAAGAAAGAAMGVPGMGLVFGALVQFATHTEEANAVLGSLSSMGTSTVSIFTGLWDTLLGVDAFLGNVLAATLPGVAAGVDGVIGGLDQFLKGISPALGELLVAITPLFELLGGVIGEVARQLGVDLFNSLRTLGSATGQVISAFAGLVRWVNAKTDTGGQAVDMLRTADAYGTAALNTAYTSVVQGLEQLAPSARSLGDTSAPERAAPVAFTDLWRGALNRQLADRNLLPAEATLRAPGAPTAPTEQPANRGILDRIHETLERIRTPLLAQQQANLGAARGLTRAPAHPGHPVVNVHIHQTINTNDDPDRVLLLTRRAVMLGVSAPLQSPGVRVTH